MIQHDHFLFCCSNCRSFGHWELFQVSPVSFKQISSIHSFSTSLLSSTTRCSRLTLCFPCPSPRIHSKKSWFFFSGEWYLEAMIWVLGVLVTTGVGITASVFSHPTELRKYVCILTHVYKHLHYFYMCLWFITLLLLCNYFSDKRNLVLIIYNIPIWSILVYTVVSKLINCIPFCIYQLETMFVNKKHF